MATNFFNVVTYGYIDALFDFQLYRFRLRCDYHVRRARLRVACQRTGVTYSEFADGDALRRWQFDGDCQHYGPSGMGAHSSVHGTANRADRVFNTSEVALT